MRLGTKILLLILAITLGLAGMVIWVVTRAVTQRETKRAGADIKRTVTDYFTGVEEMHLRNARIVRLLLGDPKSRAELFRLESADAESKAFAVAQLRDEIIGRAVQTEFSLLDAGQIAPAFHAIVN